MVVYCSVRGCRRNFRTDRGHSFFRLPTNPEICRKWREFLGIENARTHLRVCTDHFSEKDIMKRFPRPLLVRDAIPTIRRPLREQNDNASSPLNRPEIPVKKEIMICDDQAENEIKEPEDFSPPPKRVINIHVNNVSTIVISNEKNEVILHINNQEHCRDRGRQEKK